MYVAWSVVAGEQPSAAKWNILGANDAAFANGTGISALDLSVTALTNPYRFKAYRNGAFTPASGSFTKVTFETEEYDPNGNFDTTTSLYTAPVDGTYHFSARYSQNGNTVMLIAIYVDGVIYRRGNHQQVNATIGVTLGEDVDLNAGQTAGIYVFATTGNAAEVGADTRPNFSGFLVSRS